MAQRATPNGHSALESGYRVELPRECDAIGVVLRDAYERDLGLPDDMASLLRKINGRAAAAPGR